MELSLKIIARIRTDFPTKFGIPRQSGLVESLKGMIVFEKEYQNPDTLRGLEGFSHIWLIWQFSESMRENWSATVRPPRLGGNQRLPHHGDLMLECRQPEGCAAACSSPRVGPVAEQPDPRRHASGETKHL